jgi:hypothetical protein
VRVASPLLDQAAPQSCLPARQHPDWPEMRIEAEVREIFSQCPNLV